MVQKIKNQFLKFYQRHSVLVSLLVFILGFLFDLYTLKRIDDISSLIKQGTYLTLIGALLVLEIQVKLGGRKLNGHLSRFWAYHDLVIHFFFGSLLRAYTIFYYTSASAITSFLFILLVGGLMLANEIPRIQKYGLPLRIMLYNVCALSFFAYFYPILLGHVGSTPFHYAVLSSFIILTSVWLFQKKTKVMTFQVMIPTLGMHLVYILAYYLALIPPVPLAIKKMDLYYEVTKSQGNYFGKHLREDWSLWNLNFARKFYVRPGDKVMILLSIFSPDSFEDRIFLKWYIEDSKSGWHLEDTIPLNIIGGRDQGFRGLAYKQYYRPGTWRVLVETSDGREVGRVNLEIIKDNSLSERKFKTDVF